LSKSLNAMSGALVFAVDASIDGTSKCGPSVRTKIAKNLCCAVAFRLKLTPVLVPGSKTTPRAERIAPPGQRIQAFMPSRDCREIRQGMRASFAYGKAAPTAKSATVSASPSRKPRVAKCACSTAAEEANMRVAASVAAASGAPRPMAGLIRFSKYSVPAWHVKWLASQLSQRCTSTWARGARGQRSAPVMGRWFHLYLILDLYSRKIVGAKVHDSDDADHAVHLVRRTALAESIARMDTKPVLHGDNGSTLKATTVLAMLQWLGVKPSYSRPRVSDDNAYAESLFRTAKYRPEFPAKGFASLNEARAWAAEFVRWYNVDHRHSGIRYVSPQQRHAGKDQAILEARHALYIQAQ
jgi:transposase InsO family protein